MLFIRNTPKHDDTENIEMEKHMQAQMNLTKYIYAILVKSKITFEPK